MNAPTRSINLNVRGLSKSATLAVSERCRVLRQSGRRVYDFGLGQSPFPVPDPVRETLAANVHRKSYLPVEGLPELRRAIAAYHSRANSCGHGEDQVLVGPGSKELMFLLQLVYYGDLVVPTPSWVSYAPQARIIGRQVHWLPTRPEDRWMLSADTLEAHCRRDPDRPRIVVLNYPSNPTGATLRETELREIAEVARHYGIVILSDEIYGELHHEGEHASIACHYPEGTIISGGLSKWCGAGGWRLGYFLFPEPQGKIMRAMAVAASETFTSTSAPIQHAAVSAYREDPELVRYLRKSNHVLKALGGYITRLLRSAGVGVPWPDGAFYLFPDFSEFRDALASRGVTDSTALSEYLLEKTGMAALPGAAFGSSGEDLTLRLAYVDFDGARALQRYDDYGLPNIEDEEAFVKDIAPRVVEGVHRLVEEVRSW